MLSVWNILLICFVHDCLWLTVAFSLDASNVHRMFSYFELISIFEWPNDVDESVGGCSCGCSCGCGCSCCLVTVPG